MFCKGAVERASPRPHTQGANQPVQNSSSIWSASVDDVNQQIDFFGNKHELGVLMFDYETALEALAHRTVLCVGDLMLDDFVYGEVSRVSPEAPVPSAGWRSHAVPRPCGRCRGRSKAVHNGSSGPVHRPVCSTPSR